MESLTHLAGIFAVNFVYVGARAFQQLNVVAGAKALVVITSMVMAALDVFLVANYASNGWVLPLVLTVGISGALGCLFSMWFRRRFVK